MSDFDDPELRNQLGRLSGPFPDENAAYASVQRRVVRAKRRRAAAWSGGAALSVLVVVAAYALGAQQGDGSLRPATTGGSIDVGTSSTTSSPTDDTGITTSTVSGPVVPTSGPTSPDTSAPAGAAPGTTGPPATGTPGTVAPGTSAPGDGPSTSPTSQQPGPVTSTYHGEGGAITVRLQSGALVLVGTAPASGFAVTDQRDDPDRVEVRFRSDTHSTRIRVEIVDGRMSPVIEEEAS
jgi:hypothetical protein